MPPTGPVVFSGKKKYLAEKKFWPKKNSFSKKNFQWKKMSGKIFVWQKYLFARKKISGS